MPTSDPVNWQPISQMPLVTSMIEGALDDTREHLATLTSAKPAPHLLDDATLDRMTASNAELRSVTDQVVALGRELRGGTIDRILGMSDLELGLRAFLGCGPAERS